MNALVFGAKLQILKAFPQDLAFEDAAADQFYLALFNRPSAALEPAQMGDQLLRSGSAIRVGGMPRAGRPLRISVISC